MSIKIEPEEDFMSYLNTDYMSTEAPLSPPNSIGYAPEKQGDMLLDPFWTTHDQHSFMTEPKKRGRKKREIVVSPGPKPLAPYPAPTEQKSNVPKEAQLAKRQERLIKNRAAALISRKRKREHLFSLEEENKRLHEKVEQLEKQIKHLSQENLELKSIQWPDSTVKKPAKVVFMILFFSFALFSLPFQHTDLWTLGESQFNARRPNTVTPSYPQNISNLTQRSSIRPNELNSWVHRSLQHTSNTAHLYLYSHEYIQLATPSLASNQAGPSLSLVSPYNLTEHTYLQVDVQVLNSKIVDSPHIQHDPLKGRRVNLSQKGPKRVSRRFKKSRIIS